MSRVEDFFREIDAAWGGPSPKIHLRIIGASALMLRAGYDRGTRDSDILKTAALTADTKIRLLAIAGEGSAVATRHRLYVEFVSSGTPFLPQLALYHPQAALNESLRYLDIEVLDVIDVVVSKLKRFHADDQADIRAMVERELVDHQTFIERFRLAADYLAGDARASDLPTYIDHLHTVERDYFLVAESDFELPDWVDR